ncbi:MAG: hypothetical protein JNN07_01890 [Verrucomicrobiales bacterium]|nr:hypothetical protein [Verrucomicrobiales bacterium]
MINAREGDRFAALSPSVNQNGESLDMSKSMMEQISEGRTDLVFDYVGSGYAASSCDPDGISLL